VKVKQYVFTETGEVRPPKKGEWCMVEDENFMQPRSDWASSRPIITREVREVEVPDPVPAWLEEAYQEGIREVVFCSTTYHRIAKAYRKAKAEGRLDDC